MHELFHSLGITHEQSRSDRDDNVRILWDNVKTRNKNNFRVSITENRNPYDMSSIMQYGLKVSY